jgi:predicted AlkP superfamily phosphohydrolase/phosphomutase
MKAALSRWVFDKGPYDFFMTVFSEPHWAMHLLWDLLDETHPNRPQEKFIKYADGFSGVIWHYRPLDRRVA